MRSKHRGVSVGKEYFQPMNITRTDLCVTSTNRGHNLGWFLEADDTMRTELCVTRTNRGHNVGGSLKRMGVASLEIPGMTSS